MKKIVTGMIIIFVLGIFAMPHTAEAAYVNIYSLGPVFSPDSNNPSFPNKTYSTISIYGSVWMGAPSDAVNYWTGTTTQPIGIYGLGVPLASLGNNIGMYDLSFDYHFRTYDSASYDQFKAVITKGDYLWNNGTLIGGYSWGGLTRTGYESNDIQIAALQSSIYVAPASDYYLNFVLQTTGDTANASWGRFSDAKVQGVAVPEPMSLSLLGLGLLGAVGAGFRRKK
jgi:PEP-CTERM motif